MNLLAQDIFKDKILTLILKDRSFLKVCGPILEKRDFHVNGTSSRSEQIKADIAKLGLEFFDKYNEPLGELTKTEIISHAKKNRLPDSWRKEAISIARDFRRRKIKAPSYIVEKIVEFKKEQAKKNAITELIDLQETGELTDEKWQEVSQAALLPALEEKYKPIDYFKHLPDRITRRRFKKDNRFPVAFIEDLDRRVRLIARGHLGLVLAPYKRGKSQFLLHLAVALVLQKYNVIFFTLEDPREDLEDRLDSAITCLPIKKIDRMPRLLRERFARFKRFIRRRLKLVDGTGGSMSVAKMDSIIDQEYNKGFYPDAILIDYDEKIRPRKEYREKRLASDEIYKDVIDLIARRNAIGWMAAQSKRGTAASRIVTGDDAAEDISKIQKVSCCISMGQGDWGEGSIYLHIAAHRYDRQHVGCNIMSDLKRMRIYDPDKTRLAKQQHPEMRRRSE